MLRYILRRLLHSIITIFIIVSVVFLLMRLMPTDYFFTEDELMKLSEVQKHDKLLASGLLDSPFVQLGRFYKNMFSLDYTYDDRRMANISSSLNSGVTASVHSAIEAAINEYYTDSSAAAKEIDKMNGKVMTESVIQKIIDGALLVETTGEGNSEIIDYLSANLADKAGSTLSKDAKKAVGEDNALLLTEAFRADLSQQLYDTLGTQDLSIEESGWKSLEISSGRIRRQEVPFVLTARRNIRCMSVMS